MYTQLASTFQIWHEKRFETTSQQLLPLLREYNIAPKTVPWLAQRGKRPYWYSTLFLISIAFQPTNDGLTCCASTILKHTHYTPPSAIKEECTLSPWYPTSLNDLATHGMTCNLTREIQQFETSWDAAMARKKSALVKQSCHKAHKLPQINDQHLNSVKSLMGIQIKTWLVQTSSQLIW